MNIKTVSYGRTIVVNPRTTEKVWFSWEVELGENEKPAEALNTLRAMADETEMQERDDYIMRRHVDQR